MKKCNQCKIIKSTDDFWKDNSKKDNLCTLCKNCKRQSNLSYRLVNIESIKLAKKAWYNVNVEKNRTYSASYRKEHVESIKNIQARWYSANADSVNAKKAADKASNPEKHRALSKAYKKANPGKVNARSSKRHCAKLQRTPEWLSIEQIREIEQFYIDASELSWLSNGGLQVDHIIPILGKNVSGLHVPWNLQLLDSSDNNKKRNSFDGTQENNGWRS